MPAGGFSWAVSSVVRALASHARIVYNIYWRLNTGGSESEDIGSFRSGVEGQAS